MELINQHLAVLICFAVLIIIAALIGIASILSAGSQRDPKPDIEPYDPEPYYGPVRDKNYWRRIGNDVYEARYVADENARRQQEIAGQMFDLMRLQAEEAAKREERFYLDRQHERQQMYLDRQHEREQIINLVARTTGMQLAVIQHMADMLESDYEVKTTRSGITYLKLPDGTRRYAQDLPPGELEALATLSEEMKPKGLLKPAS